MTELEALKRDLAAARAALAQEQELFLAACELADRERAENAKLRKERNLTVKSQTLDSAIRKAFVGVQSDTIAPSGAGRWTPGIK